MPLPSHFQISCCVLSGLLSLAVHPASADTCLRQATVRLRQQIALIPRQDEKTLKAKDGAHALAMARANLKANPSLAHHRELARVAQAEWKARGIPSKRVKKKDHLWLIVSTDERPLSLERLPWQLRMAHALKKYGYTVVLDTKRSLEGRASHVDGKRIFLSWEDATSPYASSGTRHELVHFRFYQERLQDIPGAAPRVRIFPSETHQSFDRPKLQQLYAGPSGHALEEVFTYSYQVTSSLQTVRRLVGEFKSIRNPAIIRELEKNLNMISKKAETVASFLEVDLPLIERAAAQDGEVLLVPIPSALHGDHELRFKDGTRLRYYQSQFDQFLTDGDGSFSQTEAVHHTFGRIRDVILDEQQKIERALNEARVLTQDLNALVREAE